MSPEHPLSARDILNTYFIENRARLLEVAAFLDRIDRAPDAAEARGDYRYRALLRALGLLQEGERMRAKEIQFAFSDLSTAPLDSAGSGAATGAWRDEDH
jgi:hypothetical protein